ncbi:AEC family transporter [Pseudovibrio exalbescens]|uniref:AEC family transporter n=1 Tax=Pseudovibrio exalbescens TaxID=197461 RepID=UPI0023656C58|nr:AEC family transporter [Pseudovibrio exalbescens]MDD7909466.1 AEC family transporter [Pseudovibrio exalbescens]
MLSIFLNAVLPVFAAVVLGYVFGWMKLFSKSESIIINKTVFYVFLPALLFKLVAQAPFDKFEYLYVVGYILAEVLVYGVTFVVAYKGFGRCVRESLLLGMGAAFCNHTFFILPIAEVLYGHDATLPVISVIVIDNLLVLGGTVLALELMSKNGNGSPFHNLCATFYTNPNIMALVLGLMVNLAGISTDNGIGIYADFLGSAAAPASLFALGLVLSTQQLNVTSPLVWGVTALKLAVVPAMGWVLFELAFSLPPFWVGPGVLVAAGPSGVLAFVIGVQYEVPEELLAQVILMTTFFSVITVTAVAALTV